MIAPVPVHCFSITFTLKQDLEIKLALHSEFMARFGTDPWVQIQPIHCQLILMDSDFAFLIPQRIHLLDRNQIISHSVNKSEIHPALLQIPKFIFITLFSLFQRHQNKTL